MRKRRKVRFREWERKDGKRQITIRVPTFIHNKMHDIVLSTHDTLVSFVGKALLAHVKKHEQENGGPFPRIFIDKTKI